MLTATGLAAFGVTFGVAPAYASPSEVPQDPTSTHMTAVDAASNNCVVPDQQGRTCTDPRNKFVLLPPPGGTAESQAVIPSADLVLESDPTSAAAPKPTAPTKEWRDYILGNPTPPVRPKG